MSLRRRLVVFGYPALELLTLIVLVRWIGFVAVLLILALGALVGIVVMQTAGRNAFAILRESAVRGGPPDPSVRRHGMTFVAGALIAIPGIWSKVLGVALLIPPVQSFVAGRYLGRVLAGRGGVVVQGVVIDGHAKGPASAGPPREIE